MGNDWGGPFTEHLRGKSIPMTDTTSLSDLVRAFENADDKDWDHLFKMIPESGHGKFWKAVFTEARPILSRLMAQGGLAAAPSASLEVTNNLRNALHRMLDATEEEARLTLRHDRICENASAYEDNEITKSLDETTDAISAASEATNAAKIALRAYDASLLQTSEGCGSSNPVDDGAVERVAKAIWVAQGGLPDLFDKEIQRQDVREHWFAYARAALEAAEIRT